MSLYRPSYTDKKTGEKKRSKNWWYNFNYAGRHIQASAKTASKTRARIAEQNHRRDLEESYTGARATTNEPMQRMRTVAAAIDEYAKAYKVNHADKSQTWVEERAPHVKRMLGRLLVADITEQRLLAYMEQRLGELRARHEQPEEETGHRTTNMEIDLLARSIGQPWRTLWPKLKRLHEPKDTGRALEPDEKTKLMDAAAKNHSPYLFTLLRIAFMIGMRIGEISKLRWHQLDFVAGTISIGRTSKPKATTSRVKTEGSKRVIAMPEELRPIFDEHAASVAKKLGPIDQNWYVFPFCNSRRPVDPMHCVANINKAWTAIRVATGVECRFHDMRHTAYTDMLEDGVPDGVIEAIMGHIAPEMKARYSHVRMDAMRKAVNRNSDVATKVSTKVERSAASA
jgi:integrase